MSHMWEDKGVVVVGLDDSAASRRATLWAAREAARRGATLQVVTAWAFDALEATPMVALDPAAMAESARMIQREGLDEVLALLDTRPVVAEIVVQGPPADAIVELSKHADLVVVGTHGRGPVRSMLLGSVSQSVVRHSSCPVVVLPPLHSDETRHEDVDVRGSAAPSTSGSQAPPPQDHGR